MTADQRADTVVSRGFVVIEGVKPKIEIESRFASASFARNS